MLAYKHFTQPISHAHIVWRGAGARESKGIKNIDKTIKEFNSKFIRNQTQFHCFVLFIYVIGSAISMQPIEFFKFVTYPCRMLSVYNWNMAQTATGKQHFRFEVIVHAQKQNDKWHWYRVNSSLVVKSFTVMLNSVYRWEPFTSLGISFYCLSKGETVT